MILVTDYRLPRLAQSAVSVSDPVSPSVCVPSTVCRLTT